MVGSADTLRLRRSTSGQTKTQNAAAAPAEVRAAARRAHALRDAAPSPAPDNPVRKRFLLGHWISDVAADGVGHAACPSLLRGLGTTPIRCRACRRAPMHSVASDARDASRCWHSRCTKRWHRARRTVASSCRRGTHTPTALPSAARTGRREGVRSACLKKRLRIVP